MMSDQDRFESYFKRADLDGDGKISGAEAVAFSQGANLSKQVLAQIWAFADQSHTGFLGRSEFFNFLKLMTVAQSKRDLTPDIVKAALFGPAASKIPPPQINVSAPTALPTNQASASVATSQMGMGTPAVARNLGFPGSGGVSNSVTNQQYYPAQQGQITQSAGFFPSGSTKTVPGIAGTQQNLGVPGGRTSLTMNSTLIQPQVGIVPQIASGSLAQSQPTSLTVNNSLSQPQGGIVPQISSGSLVQSQPMATTNMSQVQSSFVSNPGISITNTKISTDWSSGNTSAMPRGPGGIAPRPVTASQPKMESVLSSNLLSSGNMLDSLSSVSKETSGSTIFSSNAAPQLLTTSKSSSFDSLQSAFSVQTPTNQPPRTQSLPNMGLHEASISASMGTGPGISPGIVKTTDNQHLSWPKMKATDIQKYTKVFMEVDMDRDGRITGDQARNLFLSWRLPRGILKQVWDLSDQDNDSMLSLREFCYALYLMERFREGRALPSSLPTTIMYDETLLSLTGQSKVAFGSPSWNSNADFGQPSETVARPMATNGMGPQTSVMHSQINPSNQPKSGEILDASFLNQTVSVTQKSEVPTTDEPNSNKGGDSANSVMDSKEKMEFYRTKMQELILYKSRCDNKLNEITERALADKKEAEILGKKYEEKYKQAAEVASKLTIEEGTLRDIQGRKMELHQAIINVEQGGSADGLLQVRGDRVQSDLDELMKALIDRSKKHGIEIKSSSMIELPIGWKPGVPENAATWDEEWDKFEDEGFSLEIVGDPIQDDKASNNTLYNNGASSHVFDNNEHAGSIHSEDDFMRSPQDSPGFRAPQDFSDIFTKSTEAETEHRFDDASWLTMEGDDDVDSVWGFNTSSNKDMDLGKHSEPYGSEDFGLSIRTEPHGDNSFPKRSVFFEDSVPGTPASKFGNSPRYSEAGDHYSSFSRFDSFTTHDGGFSPSGQQKNTSFYSHNTPKESAQRHTFSSFDDADPFGSSGPFHVARDN